MKRLTVFLTLVVFLVAANASAQVAPAGKGKPNPQPPTVFSDNFNDGDTVGWSFSALAYPGGGIGNWRVEDGELVQDLGGDHYKALVENLVLSGQRIESSINVHPYGYGGVTVWYQDWNHWVEVLCYPGYGTMEVIELDWDEINQVTLVYHAKYPFPYAGGVWYRLRVDADSRAGTLKVFMDDLFLFTHQTTVTERTGLSGLNSGNYGTHFDDFKVNKLGGGKK
jgi:hypothetical protein